jgi:hypothetical protein
MDRRICRNSVGQAVIAIAGNKLDLDDAQSEFAEAEECAKTHNYLIVETSAITGAEMQNLFRERVEEIVRARSSERFIGTTTDIPREKVFVQEEPNSQPCC